MSTELAQKLVIALGIGVLVPVALLIICMAGWRLKEVIKERRPNPEPWDV